MKKLATLFAIVATQTMAFNDAQKKEHNKKHLRKVEKF